MDVQGQHFNEWLGDKLANWLSTMAMFYGVTFLVFLPLFFQRPNGLVGWAQYSSSVFFQGVALPVLGYVSKKEGDRNEKLMRETHDTVMKELSMIKKELKLAGEERNALKSIMAKLNGSAVVTAPQK
jgi:hypothetical protein